MFGWFKKKAPTRPTGPTPYPWGMYPNAPGGMYPAPMDAATPGLGPNVNELPGAWPLGIPQVDSRGILDQTGQMQPLPASVMSQLLYSNPTRYRPFTAHTFIQARLPDPGAPQYTFDALGLVEFSAIGTGIPNQGEILALEGATLFPNLMIPLQGLGGIVQGGLVLQPLMADPTTTAEIQVG